MCVCMRHKEVESDLKLSNISEAANVMRALALAERYTCMFSLW